MIDSGSGSLIIKNLDENIIISQKYENGIFASEVVVENNESFKGLCQRKKGESFKDCNARETSEFCDDLISTIAYLVNPEIPILIAALCSC